MRPRIASLRESRFSYSGGRLGTTMIMLFLWARETVVHGWPSPRLTSIARRRNNQWLQPHLRVDGLLETGHYLRSMNQRQVLRPVHRCAFAAVGCKQRIRRWMSERNEDYTNNNLPADDSTSSSTRSKDSSSSPTTVDYNKLPRLYVGMVRTHPTVIPDWTALGTVTSTGQRHSQVHDTPPLSSGSIVPLSMDQTHYVTSVLRLFRHATSKSTKQQVSQNPVLVRLWDGRSNEEWLAELQQLSAPTERSNGDKKQQRRRRAASETAVVAAVCRTKLRSNVSPTSSQLGFMSCWLCVASPKKKDRCRWMIEKTTELDCTGYILIDTDYSEALDGMNHAADAGQPWSTMKRASNDNNDDLSSSSLGKLPIYTVEAAEQCERLTLPIFLAMDLSLHSSTTTTTTTKLSELLQLWSTQPSDDIVLLVCRERSSSRCLPVWSALERINKLSTAATGSEDGNPQRNVLSVVFLIGPEGGWSPREEMILDNLEKVQHDIDDPAHIPKVWNVSLGPTVLRAETAAVTSMAAYSLHREHVLSSTLDDIGKSKI